ncbi:MAG: hypothetical protein AVDCRST_MAG77-5841, partial [uncultured Chloroflexi bacterium]
CWSRCPPRPTATMTPRAGTGSRRTGPPPRRREGTAGPPPPGPGDRMASSRSRAPRSARWYLPRPARRWRRRAAPATPSPSACSPNWTTRRPRGPQVARPCVMVGRPRP